MADRDTWRKNIPEDYDGRFGERFDQEVDTRGVAEITIGIAVTCAIGMAITWWMLMSNTEAVEKSAPEPPPIAQVQEQELPSGPLLQAKPEEELRQMQAEMETLLNGYGWVDEGAGVAHIPIERAIDLLADSGGAMPSAPADAAEDASGEASAAPDDGGEQP